jgi:hypothetical protein
VQRYEFISEFATLFSKIFIKYPSMACFLTKVKGKNCHFDRKCRFFACRNFTDHPTLLAKRASDHSPSPSPIFGKGM